MGLGSEIRDPEKTYSGFRIQGSKRHRIPDPDQQHCKKETKTISPRLGKSSAAGTTPAVVCFSFCGCCCCCCCFEGRTGAVSTASAFDLTGLISLLLLLGPFLPAFCLSLAWFCLLSDGLGFFSSPAPASKESNINFAHMVPIICYYGECPGWESNPGLHL
jgi:hypothetical protein